MDAGESQGTVGHWGLVHQPMVRERCRRQVEGRLAMTSLTLNSARQRSGARQKRCGTASARCATTGRPSEGGRKMAGVKRTERGGGERRRREGTERGRERKNRGGCWCDESGLSEQPMQRFEEKTLRPGAGGNRCDRPRLLESGLSSSQVPAACYALRLRGELPAGASPARSLRYQHSPLVWIRLDLRASLLHVVP